MKESLFEVGLWHSSGTIMKCGLISSWREAWCQTHRALPVSQTNGRGSDF